jgi:hypothetical protein
MSRREMLDQMSQVAAKGVAIRAARLNPDDPDAQIATNAILGLWIGRPGRERRENRHQLTPRLSQHIAVSRGTLRVALALMIHILSLWQLVAG